jgi:regulator of nucleoside diphosphate kinase
MRKPIPYSCPICASRLPRAASRCFFCEHPLPRDKGRATRRALPSAPRVEAQTRRPQDLPRLYVAVEDFGRLEPLAHIALDRDAGVELLRGELERAIVCDEESVPQGIVRMGSIVSLQDRGEDGSVVKIRGILVYPDERHPTLPSIPISSPLGAAVLGLTVGDTMPYEGADGLRHAATVLSTVRPESAGKPPLNPTNHDGVAI